MGSLMSHALLETRGMVWGFNYSFKKIGVSCRPQVKKFIWGDKDKFILFVSSDLSNFKVSEPVWNAIEVEKILATLYKNTTSKKVELTHNKLIG